MQGRGQALLWHDSLGKRRGESAVRVVRRKREGSRMARHSPIGSAFVRTATLVAVLASFALPARAQVDPSEIPPPPPEDDGGADQAAAPAEVEPPPAPPTERA